MKRVYSAAHLPEARILADLLASLGIRARIFNANASSLAGELPIDCASPQLWVEDPADADRARAAIDAFLRRAPAAGTRTCPECGEESPADFDLCWRCGRSLG